jgi:hypothetical protein
MQLRINGGAAWPGCAAIYSQLHSCSTQVSSSLEYPAVKLACHGQSEIIHAVSDGRLISHRVNGAIAAAKQLSF